MTKLNKKNKGLYNEAKINDIKNDGKRHWRAINEIMGRKTTPTFIETDGLFITKPFDVANYINDYLIVNVDTLRQEMPTTNSEPSYLCIKKTIIMKVKHCKVEFWKVSVGEVENVLLSTNNAKPPGIDNLDGKQLRMVADTKATHICHIFNLSLEESLCPQARREAKVTPLPKSGKAAFTGSNSRPISLLPALSKLLEKCI